MPRRATDRVEDAAAWFVAAAGLLLLLGAALVGVGIVDRDALDRAAAPERTPADTVLVDSPALHGVPGSSASRTARHVDAAGAERHVVVTVRGRPPAGTTVHAVVDSAGRTVQPPTRAGSALPGASAAFWVAFAGTLLLAGVWLGLRLWLDLRNAEAWDREWARVEPEWRGG